MFIGFDYGTANCSVAAMLNGQPELIELEGSNVYLPSTVAAPTRESIAEHLFRHSQIKPLDSLGEQCLRRAIARNQDEGVDLHRDDLVFGRAALELYLDDPREVYYVKSPKSFLGATGLHDTQLQFFEDLVCSMMYRIKSQAESRLNQDITQAMIGRPINFHGRGGELSNSQAQNILQRAATRAGFKQVEFQFEPVAAGLDYESTLSENKKVLVVDIGGGTTDCSIIEMGPKWQGKLNREGCLLAHSGQRVGGNDLDISLAFKTLMTPFGLNSALKNGLTAPVTQFWNPIAINNLEAQNDFYQLNNLKELKRLQQEAVEPEKLERLLEVYQRTLGHSLVSHSENAKIQLSSKQKALVAIVLENESLSIEVSESQMREAIVEPQLKMVNLVKEAINQAQTTPDVIYITGGSARSNVLREAVQQAVPHVPLASGNYFGSVTAGLARWAQVVFA